MILLHIMFKGMFNMGLAMAKSLLVSRPKAGLHEKLHNSAKTNAFRPSVRAPYGKHGHFECMCMRKRLLVKH